MTLIGAILAILALPVVWLAWGIGRLGERISAWKENR